jgi:purine-nucleoside phosphorylase
MYEASKLSDAEKYVQQQTSSNPTIAIILGSGLGGLAQSIEGPTTIPYHKIPGFKTSSAKGHRGELIIGNLEGTTVVVMAGRLHRYEGWSNDDIAFPVHLMSRIGADRLIVSNAAGGVSPKLSVGDIVVIRDHINWMGGQSSRKPAVLAPSPLRSDALYDDAMSSIAMRVGVDGGFNTWEGTYLATLGPTYETRSEYRMMRRIGADVAGMSTVPEVLAAASLEMRILGLSMVSNVANPDVAVVADHAEVLEAGQASAAKMESIVRGVLVAT